MKVTRIKEERLSDSGLITLSKHGHKYTVMRGYLVAGEYIAPDVTLGLNKKQAEDMFIGYLRDDVLEAHY